MKPSAMLLTASLVLVLSALASAQTTNTTNAAIDRLVKPYGNLTSTVVKDLQQQKLDLMSLRTSDRHLKTVLWLKLLNRVDGLHDPDYDPQDRANAVAVSVAPPLDLSNIRQTMYYPGTDPKTIKEPEIRAAFEKAILENHKNYLRSDFEDDLRRISEDSTELALRYFAATYVKTPADAKELIASLDIISNEKHRAELTAKLADYVKLLKPSS